MAIERTSNNKVEDQGETVTRKIPLNEPEETNPDMEVDFQSEEMAHEFATKGTKPSADGPKLDPSTPADKIAEDLAKYEAGKTAKLTYQDLNKFAEWIMTLIDTTVSSALKWIARDTSHVAYKMPPESKKMLTEQLAIILSRYQHKFRVEFIFFIGLVMVYAPVSVVAVQNRKRNPIKERREKQINSKVKDAIEKQKVNESITSPIQEETSNIPKPEVTEEKIVEEVKVPLRRRGRGRPARVA